MPGTTTRYGINYPLQTDPTNVPGNIETPMDEIDAILTGTFTGVLASRPAFGIMGRRYYASDTGNIYFDTGAGWLNEGPINTVLGNITLLTPGGAKAVGNSGFSADAAHAHLLPGWGANSDYQPDGTSGVAGSTGRFADAGHIHPGDPAGIIKMFGGTVAPSGHVLCNGLSYATATYPSLFAAIGYQWGGSGANFNVPNIVDRSPVGAGNSYTVGQLGGASQITLNAAMLAAHTHSISDPDHTHPAYISEVGPSDQVIYTMNTLTGNVYSIPTTGNAGAGSILVGNSSAVHIQQAATGITGTNLSATPTQSVPLYHPVAGVNFIIRAY